MAADRRLDRHFGDEQERRRLTARLFDDGAPGYDLAERLTALGSGRWYRREVLRRQGVGPGTRLLDVAAGTGLVTAEALRLVGPTGRVLALDPSPGMLAELHRKLPGVQTIEAFAESIPLDDAQVDFVSMGYALRHVSDLDRVFAEYLRVLRPGGRACVMEISRPAGRLARALLRAHIGGVVPGLALLLGRRQQVSRLWAYYRDTIEAAVDPGQVQDAMRRAGFAGVRCDLTMGIFREYTGTRPAGPGDHA